MIRPPAEFPSQKSLTLLSRTLLQRRGDEPTASRQRSALTHDLLSLGRTEFKFKSIFS